MATSTSESGSQRTIKASEFKSKCLKIMDEVNEDGGEIIITKNGRPVAKLTAFQARPKTLFGAGRDRMKILGDIISPIEVEWEAQASPDRAVDP